ncbi:hypothetical protein [Bordetella sp. 02P26C-1]|uniref:hypothetical protein n=1 Tax=Bordetella sp. 02P26C-1 TaxID=2683195 RepID=UPI001354D1D5|nr:hypothetical protein [Bordetella sp. 02P26C-1]MVW80203.1 hypothetical protein [Bordetella sp. 02P26C-1]
MEADTVTIAFRDKSRGYEISPDRVPLTFLTAVSKDVQDFIKGPGKDIDMAEVEVCIRHGSLAIQSGHVVSASLVADIQALSRSTDLAKVSKRRREIVRKWQERAHRVKGFVVRIATPWTGNDILVSGETNYREARSSRVVTVERYIKGEILDLGGVTDSNAHIKLPDGQKLTIKTDRELIRSEPRNLVYREVHLRIRAKLDLDTQKLSDPELISFVDYEPKFDPNRFAEAVRKGREAWRDVGDPAEWVRSIRGEN